jgi:hypothetical protein
MKLLLCLLLLSSIARSCDDDEPEVESTDTIEMVELVDPDPPKQFYSGSDVDTSHERQFYDDSRYYPEDD